MFNGRLQPERVTPSVHVFFLVVGILGLAAATGRAGQTLTNAPLLVDKVKSQVSSQSPKPRQDQSAVQTPGKSPKGAATRKAELEASKKTTPGSLSSAAGRRDPFKAWAPLAPGSGLTAGAAAGALPAGIRGLVISDLRLEGTVRQLPANTMIAVVTNSTKRAYFLRASDTVYNGVVSRITPEAIYFMENTLDSNGRVATREVAIKLGSTPGEAR